MVPLSLNNPWPGAPTLFRKRTRSTMEDALTLARDGYPAGTTVVADYQEAGRGRLAERQWRSEEGKNLLFTQLLRDVLPDGPQRLPLLVGLAVARALEGAFGLAPAIKWPNDVLCPLPGRHSGKKRPAAEDALGSGHGARADFASAGGVFASEGGVFAKVAGVLCEAATSGSGLLLLAGVGLNCNQLEFPEEPGAVSLALLLGREVDRLQLLERILGEIRAALSDRGWKAALLHRLYCLGREVAFHQAAAGDSGASSVLRGVLDGVEDDGALRLRLPGGQTTALYSGELTALPAGGLPDDASGPERPWKSRED
jgi:BirA family biotin operon repressor/biotin-[acetyl-CoA-carboxylase] ligase